MAQDIYNILSTLGYKLQDRGDYWQSSAIFRGGDNPTALQIYKDSGVWKDYVSGDSFLPFKLLLEKTPGAENFIDGNFDFNIPKTHVNSPESRISLEKTFSNSFLEELLPHHDFYNSKGISNQTLNSLKAGLCTGGSMYQRYVFPIFNKHGKIQGLAGRDLLENSSRPKWKHMGKKTKWIYPLYSINNSGDFIILESIKSNNEVILVESIGDFLSLFEFGITNVLVTFGLDISPSLISILLGLNLDSIVLSFNNDFHKSENSGKNAVIKNFLKLLSYFDQSKINISLPIKNDFGDMNKKDFEKWIDKKNINKQQNSEICVKVLEHSKKMFSQKKISAKIYSNIKKLDCYE